MSNLLALPPLDELPPLIRQVVEEMAAHPDPVTFWPSFLGRLARLPLGPADFRSLERLVEQRPAMDRQIPWEWVRSLIAEGESSSEMTDAWDDLQDGLRRRATRVPERRFRLPETDPRPRKLSNVQKRLLLLCQGLRFSTSEPLEFLTLSSSSLLPGITELSIDSNQDWPRPEQGTASLLVEGIITSSWRLRSLSIRDYRIGDEGLIALADSPVCRELSSLSLQNAGLTQRSLLFLAKISAFPHLRELRLSENAIHDEGVQAYLASPSSALLEHLNLAENEITSASLKAIAERPFPPRLQSLWLAKNHIDDEGLLALAASPVLSGLTFLDLSDNPLREDGFLALAASPSVASLQTLFLSDTLATKKAVRAIAESTSFASLRSLYLGGEGVPLSSFLPFAETPWFPSLAELCLYEIQGESSEGFEIQSASSPFLPSLQWFHLLFENRGVYLRSPEMDRLLASRQALREAPFQDQLRLVTSKASEAWEKTACLAIWTAQGYLLPPQGPEATAIHAFLLDTFRLWQTAVAPALNEAESLSKQQTDATALVLGGLRFLRRHLRGFWSEAMQPYLRLFAACPLLALATEAKGILQAQDTFEQEQAVLEEGLFSS